MIPSPYRISSSPQYEEQHGEEGALAMKKALFVLLIAILTMVSFVSCKEELKPKTVVGSWEASVGEMTMTIDMKSDGTLAGTGRGEEQDGDETVTITVNMTGSYAASSNRTLGHFPLIHLRLHRQGQMEQHIQRISQANLEPISSMVKTG